MNIDAPGRGLSLPFMKRPPADGKPRERRLQGFEWLPNRWRNHFIAMMGEFVGTFMFLFFAFSATQVANAASAGANSSGDGSLTQAPNTSALLYISLAFGFSLAVNAWVFFRITGGLFNPAVTFGMWMIGAVKWLRAILILIAQLLGSMAASGVVQALFPGPMNVSTTLGGGTSIARGVFIEMFLTALLVFTIFMLAAEKHKATFIAPVGIGLALFVAELTGVYFTGGSLNPARSFGPCVVLHVFPGYHWIYWVGPLLGALIAVGFYRLIKVLEYETANPGQDFNDKEAEVFSVDEDTAATATDVARPNIAIGRSEYIADDNGIHQSQDIRQSQGRAPKAPANYNHPSPLPEETSPAGRTRSNGPRGRYDGADGEKRHSRSTSRTHVDNVSAHKDPYRASSDAERGELGGRYRVSGL